MSGLGSVMGGGGGGVTGGGSIFVNGGSSSPVNQQAPNMAGTVNSTSGNQAQLSGWPQPGGMVQAGAGGMAGGAGAGGMAGGAGAGGMAGGAGGAGMAGGAGGAGGGLGNANQNPSGYLSGVNLWVSPSSFPGVSAWVAPYRPSGTQPDPSVSQQAPNMPGTVNSTAGTQAQPSGWPQPGGTVINTAGTQADPSGGNQPAAKEGGDRPGGQNAAWARTAGDAERARGQAMLAADANPATRDSATTATGTPSSTTRTVDSSIFRSQTITWMSDARAHVVAR
jgi:hypothetical protein